MAHVLNLKKKKSHVVETVMGFLVVTLFFATIVGWTAALTQPTCTALNQKEISCK